MTPAAEDRDPADPGLGRRSGPDFRAPEPLHRVGPPLSASGPPHGSAPAPGAATDGLAPGPDPGQGAAEPLHPDRPARSDETEGRDPFLGGFGYDREVARQTRRYGLAAFGALLGIAVLVVVLVAGLSRGFAPSTAPPTPSASSRPGPSTAAPAQPMSGPGFTFTAPDGWARAEDWGRGNDARVVDRDGNDITVYSWDGDDADARCEAETRALQIWVPGVIDSVPTREIDSRPAPGRTLRGTGTDADSYVLRCVALRGRVVNVSSQAGPGDEQSVARAYDAVLDSWRWD